MASSGRDISGVPSRDDERNQTIRSQFEDYEDSTTGNEDGNEDDSEASHSTAGTSNVNVNVARTYAPPSEGDGELVPYGRGNEEDSGLSGTIPEGEEVHRFETQRGVLYETEGYDYDDDQQSTGSYETTDTGYSSIPAHAYNDEESTTPSLNTTTTGYSSIPAHAYNDEEASTAQSLNTTATGNSSIPTHAYNDEESLAGQSQSTIATTATATSLLGTALLGSSSSHSTGYAEHTQHSRRSIGLAQVAEEEDELSDVMEPNPQATEGRLVVRQMTPERQRGEEGGETAQSGDSSSQRTSVDSSVERSLVLVEPEPLSRQQQGRTAAGRRVRKTKVTTVPEGDSSTSYVDDTSESTSTTQTSKDFFDLALPQSEKADMQEASSTEGRLTHKSSHSAKSSYGLASTFETVDSNRSAGWSRYDDDVSMDSKNQFFERGLPMSAEDQAAWEKDIAEAERAADNAAQQRRSADEESLGIDTTIAGEHNSGESRGVDQQQGYYEDDATIQSTGPNYWNSRFSSNFGRPETIYEGSVETESHATPSIAPSRQSSTKSGSTKSRASTYASRESASTRESSMRPTDPPSIQDGYSAQDDYESVQGDESYVSDGDYSRASSLHKPRMSTYSTYSSYSQSKRSSRYDYRASDSRSLAGRSMTEESMRSMTSRSVGADSFGAGSRPSTASGSTGPSIMGMVQRPTTSREQRRFMSREVEVSMDGFMHQAKPPTSSNISSTLQDYPYIAIPNGAGGGRAPWDKSSSSLSNRIATISSLLFLVATAIFFAAHVGPFVVQPPIATTRNSQGGGSSQSSAFLANGGNGTDPNAPGTVVADVTTATSPLVPDFILGKFLNWRVPYTDITTELPVLFTYGKSGGEIAAHAFGQCLAKVNAGNGRDFDPNLVHTADFTAEVQFLQRQCALCSLCACVVSAAHLSIVGLVVLATLGNFVGRLVVCECGSVFSARD